MTRILSRFSSNFYYFFDFDQGDVSPNQNLIIFSTDTQGRGLRTIQIFDIKNRKTLNDRVESIDGGHAWCSDNKTFFYTRQDPETLRSFQVWKHSKFNQRTT